MDEHPVRNLSNSGFNGKIMLTSVIIILLAFIIVVLFHIYARNRHHHLRNQSERRRDLYLASSDSAISEGLDPSILNELSTFRFSYKSKIFNGQPLECAVCLSEFEDGEIGRVLPNCNHCFHLQCIDAWFQFHSNCPLCRAPVQPIKNIDQVVGIESGLSSVLNPVSQRVEEDQITCSTSVCGDKKLPELTSITWEASGMSQKLTSDAVFH